MSNEPPLVSVVMSCFNDAAHVSHAIDSIRQQSVTNWELIVINDGSGDDTANILNQYAEIDSRIRIIHQENVGLTKALIKGCQESRANYIARHDADDISAPLRFEKQFQVLDSNDAIGFVSSWTDSFSPDGAVLDQFRIHDLPKNATHKLLHERQGPPAHGSVMMRRSVYEQVGGYRSCFYFGQDSDLWLRMAEQSQFAFVNEVLYRYLRSPTSISGKRRHIQRQFGELGQLCRQARAAGESETCLLQAAEQLTTELIDTKHDSTKTDSHSQLAMTYLIGSQLAGNKDPRARSYLWRVLRHQPWHWKAWVRLSQSFLNAKKPEARSEDLPSW